MVERSLGIMIAVAAGVKQILLLDDEMSITFSLSRCLGSDKVGIICCNDSASAKAVISRTKVDAVITDVKLSVGDPLEALDFLKYVRSLEPDVPVIMMSGTEDLKAEVLQEGATYFFTKPVDLDDLILLLRTLGLEVAGPHATKEMPNFQQNEYRL
jgi:DNA-binding NtrC family response regulator